MKNFKILKMILIFIQMLIIANCNVSQNDVSNQTTEEDIATNTAPEYYSPEQANDDASTEIGIILALFDGQTVDEAIQQPIFTVYRLNKEGFLYQLYTPPTHNQFGEDYTISKDGKWIAFSQQDTETRQSDVYKLKTNGEGLLNLTNTSTNERKPTWSSDGNSIAFVMWDENPGLGQIGLMNSNGEELEVLPTNKMNITDIKFSPVANSILVEVYDENEYKGKLYTYDLDTMTYISIYEKEGSARSGFWSPGGTKIVFTVREYDVDSIGVYDTQTQKYTEVPTGDILWQSSACGWSPNGQYIIVRGAEINSIDNYDLYLWDTHTEQISPLTKEIEYPTYFMLWSPDTRQLLLSASINGPEMQFYMIDISTKEINLLVGFPNLSFGVLPIGWGNLEKMTEYDSPIAGDITTMSVSDSSKKTNIPSEPNPTLAEVSVTTLDTIAVRTGPSTQYPIIDEIDKGTTLIALGVSPGHDWLQIQSTVPDSDLAWIYALYTDYDYQLTPLNTVTDGM